VIVSVVYLVARGLLGCLMVLARREVSKDAGLLVLRHENAVLRRHAGRVRYQPADRLWLAALSRLIPRRRWGAVFAVTRRRCSPGTVGWSHADGTTAAGGVPAGRLRQP
jgi:putative transposase